MVSGDGGLGRGQGWRDMGADWRKERTKGRVQGEGAAGAGVNATGP